MRTENVTQPAANAEKITRASKSNLALAFISLGAERRRAMTVFYAFCRVIDDIADSPELPKEEKARQLTRWHAAVRAATRDEDPLAAELRSLVGKYSIPHALLEEIIAGVEMDLRVSRYRTFEELRAYCYRVASAVGLASIEIFGYRNPQCREYAVQLGLALQVTNIIRDVAKDLENDRVYLPEEDMQRFGVTEAELQRRAPGAGFYELMKFEADRAREFFARAAALLPPEDRRSMVAAEIMSAIYRDLLARMERDRFRVFEKEYRLTKLAKSRHVFAQLLKFR